ncbi:hypothetical protein VTJ83DRAFT_198 [Remersonia thermophila]|uniref:Uncharacterized protein n=1 Tax=Remersonia thermophila TaxID=72144 RepID=A0ABR4DM69_9PEZI
MGTRSGAAALSSAKITKARGKVKAVKPMLKRLSHSEKTSLDLDQGWDAAQIEQLEVGCGRDDGGYGGAAFYYSGQARDVTFAPVGEARSPRRFPQHGRSASQASAGSGPRGPFLHPFAQTPRTATPPRSYANSVASVDHAREYSPTITERDDRDDCDDDNNDNGGGSGGGGNDDGFDTRPSGLHSHPHSHSHSHSRANSHGHASATAASSQSNLRRPSLNSQRTASFPDYAGSKPPSLKISIGNRSISGTTAASCRFGHGGSLPTASSASDLVDSHALGVSLTGTLDSPTGSVGAGSAQPSPPPPPPPPSQLSPLRTSLDMGSFPRLRAKSEMDTATRVETIRAARRKFEERERAKEEKYDREMIKKRERRDTKEAARIEKGEAPSRPKRTSTSLSIVSEPPSSATARGIGGIGGIGRRRHTDLSSSSNHSTAASEKNADFAARPYESASLAFATPPAFGPTAEDADREQAAPRRGSSAKRKTQSYWQGFLLWLRTKLLRLSTR